MQGWSMILSPAPNAEAGVSAFTAVTKENVSCAEGWATAQYVTVPEPAFTAGEMLRTVLCVKVPANAQVAREPQNARNVGALEAVNTVKDQENVIIAGVPERLLW